MIAQVQALFHGVLTLAVVSTVVMFLGAVLVRRLGQPIERVRCVQLTVVCFVLVLGLRQASVLPTINLRQLGSPTAQTDAHNATDVAESSRTSRGTEAQMNELNESFIAALHVRGDIGDLVDQHALSESFSEAREVESRDVAESASGLMHGVRANSADGATTLRKVRKIGQYGIAIGFACGASLSCVLLMVGQMRLGRLYRESTPIDEDLLSQWRAVDEAKQRGTEIRTSGILRVPLTFGVWRPVIVLPASVVASRDRTALHYCLAHEWAHVRSRDVASWWLLSLLQPLLWFQPLYWYLRRELRTAQDQMADYYATQGMAQDPTDYASLLVRFARERMLICGQLALTMSNHRSTLYRRIEMLCDQRPLVSAARRSRVVPMLAGVILLSLALGAVRLDSVQATPLTPNETANQEAVAESNSEVEADAADEAETKSTTPTIADDSESGDESSEAATSQDEVASPELSYSGVVLDKSNDQPIAGAVVIVRRMILKSTKREIVQETEHTTDEQGRYSFVIPPEQTGDPSMYIELDVAHDDYAWKKGFGYSLSMIRKNERLGEEPFFSEVKLWPSEPITGRVVDASGEPVPDTFIQAYSTSSGNSFEYGSFFKTKTSDDGTFKLQMIKGGPSVFWIVPRDYAPAQVVSGTKRGEWGDITVNDGISVRGRVVNATGEPVEGVWVNLLDHFAQAEVQLPVATSMCRTALTDDNGEFVMAPMKAGRYRLEVNEYPREHVFHVNGKAKRIEPKDVFVSQTIEVTENDADRPYILQAKPHVTFRGQYLDSKGEPRSGHRVTFFGNLDGQWYHTQITPDENGKLEGKLPHGLSDVKMDAITNEHSAIQVRLEANGELLAGRNLVLGTVEDDIEGVEIIRYTAPIVHVKPLDEEGNVVRDCQVSGVYSDGKVETMTPVGGRPTNIFFETQRDGRYRTQQMIPDRQVTFTVTKDGYRSDPAQVTLPEGGEKELTIVLSKVSENANGDADDSADESIGS